MNALRTLVAMQLKEKMNLKGNRLTLKERILKTGLTCLKYLGIIAVCYLMFYVCILFGLFNVGFIPTSVLVLIFGVMMGLSIISVTLSLLKSLYFSRDNQILLTYPCSPSQVFLSKLIVFYVYEFKRSLSFLIPLFFAFCLVNGYPIYAYIWIIFCFLFVSAIPILVGVVLSLPLMFICNIFRQYKNLQYGLLAIFILLVAYGAVSLISVIPTDIDLLNNWVKFSGIVEKFLSDFAEKVPFIRSLTYMVAGQKYYNQIIMFNWDTLLTLVKTIGFIVVLLGLSVLIISPFFYSMASKPFEYLKMAVKEKKNRRLNSKLSILKTELLLNIRQPSLIFTCVGLLLVLPISIFFLNRIFNAMNIRKFGEIISIAFNFLMILLICLNSNYYAASVYSKDGRSSYLLQVQPSKPQVALLSKLVFNTVFIIAGLGLTLCVLIYNTYYGVTNCILIILICFFCYLAHLFYSAQLDITNPKTELYNNTAHPDMNENENKSTVVAFLVSFALFAIMLFLLNENSLTITYIKVTIVMGIIMLHRLYLLLNNITVYYGKRC